MNDEKFTCILRSIFKFWNNPNLEELIEKSKAFNTVKIIKIGECDTESIFLVNGDIVKEKMFPDFVEGGNDAVYGKSNGQVAKFMPQNQIWLDSNEDINSIPYICLHELVERYYMTSEHKLKYNKAHDKANILEDKLRNKNVFESKRNILKFPRIKQPNDASCGETTIAMVLQYNNIEEKIENIKKLIPQDEIDDGISIKSIQSIFNKFNLNNNIEDNLDYGKIKENINKENVMIVGITSGEDYHYSIIIGYTLENIIFADPSIFYKTYMKYDDFIKRLYNKMAIVVEHNGEIFSREKTVKIAKIMHFSKK